jgi:hypothetical protein
MGDTVLKVVSKLRELSGFTIPFVVAQKSSYKGKNFSMGAVVIVCSRLYQK